MGAGGSMPKKINYLYHLSSGAGSLPITIDQFYLQSDMFFVRVLLAKRCCYRWHAVLHLLVVACSACVQSIWSCSGRGDTPPRPAHQIDQNPDPLARSLAKTEEPFRTLNTTDACIWHRKYQRNTGLHNATPAHTPVIGPGNLGGPRLKI